MKNKFILTISVLTFLIIPKVFANELENIASDVVNKSLNKAGEIVGDIIPGDGDTEITITAQDDYDLKYSILAVRPITLNPFQNLKENHLLFTQIRLSNNEPFADGDDRLLLNAGLGFRTLAQDGNAILGANFFYDHELEQGHERVSLGLEYLTSVFEVYANRYERISSSTSRQTFYNPYGQRGINVQEEVLDGYDIHLVGQIPYMPWGKFVYKAYNWNSTGKDTEGKKYQLEAQVTDSLILEFGRNDQDGISKQKFGAITMRWPSKDNNIPTVFTHTYTEEMFAEKDMSNEMLHKVRRTDAIVVERKSGGMLITRGI